MWIGSVISGLHCHAVRISSQGPWIIWVSCALSLSLLEKTRAAFLFNSKCLLNSPAHTCQHWMRGTLVAWQLMRGRQLWYQTLKCSMCPFMFPVCSCEKKIKKTLWTLRSNCRGHTVTWSAHPLSTFTVSAPSGIKNYSYSLLLTAISWNPVWLGARASSGNTIPCCTKGTGYNMWPVNTHRAIRTT